MSTEQTEPEWIYDDSTWRRPVIVASSKQPILTGNPEALKQAVRDHNTARIAVEALDAAAYALERIALHESNEDAEAAAITARQALAAISGATEEPQ